MVASCGFTLIARYPFLDLNILDLTHNYGPNYLDLKNAPEHEKVSIFRSDLMQVKNIWETISSRPHAELFIDMSQLCGPTIMANHHNNHQVARMYKSKEVTGNVTGPDSFPDRNVNWQKVKIYSDQFKPAGWIMRASRKLHMYRLKMEFALSNLFKKPV